MLDAICGPGVRSGQSFLKNQLQSCARYNLRVPQGEYLQYGGQAVIEGVMMRSPRYFSIACRAPNGEIIIQTEAVEKTWIGRQKWLRWPFLRGSLALLDTMALGTRSMRFAANVQLAPEHQALVPGEAPAVVEKAADGSPKKNRVQDTTIGGAMVFALLVGVCIFNYLPNLIAQNLERFGSTGMMINFVTEIVKIVIFLGYLALIGQSPDIREVFKYHGAEHKAINTMEAEQPLSMENCLAQTRLHPRCGTSFAITVLIVSMVIFTFVPRYPFGHSLGFLPDATLRFGVELLVLPLISGIAYELIRIAGRFRRSEIVHVLFWPGLMSQYLTTREPEPRHVEIAIAALKSVIEAEHGVESQKGTVSDELESAPPMPFAP